MRSSDAGLIVYTESRTPHSAKAFSRPKRAICSPALRWRCSSTRDSASASEVVAAALRDNQRAVVLGVASFGKGSVQSVMTFQKRRAIKLTTARYYTPAGASLEEVGVTPDIAVPASAEESASDYETRLLARTVEALHGHARGALGGMRRQVW